MKPYTSFAGTRLLEIYGQLMDALGPSHWWPGTTPLEVVVGAVLTQNTAWGNVEKAIVNLTGAGILPADAPEPERLAESARDSGEKLLALPEEELAELIRPTGSFRVKARRLKNVLQFFAEYNFDLAAIRHSELSTDTLRQHLLKLNGVGPETADSILLYALERPTFVVDAYTLRMLGRHALLPGGVPDYERTRALFMRALPPHDTLLYNEYHALIVRACKTWCLKSSPRCLQCPLGYGLSHHITPALC